MATHPMLSKRPIETDTRESLHGYRCEHRHRRREVVVWSIVFISFKSRTRTALPNLDKRKKRCNLNFFVGSRHGVSICLSVDGIPMRRLKHKLSTCNTYTNERRGFLSG